MATKFKEQLPAGKYWVGDLCYVMHDVWDEVCNGIFDKPADYDRYAHLQLADGRKFGFSFTAYGDGTYFDQHCHNYGVDAGLLGCILVDDIVEAERGNIPSGHVIDFENSFSVEYDDGTIYIGHLRIETDEPEDDWEDDDPEYDNESEN